MVSYLRKWTTPAHSGKSVVGLFHFTPYQWADGRGQRTVAGEDSEKAGAAKGVTAGEMEKAARTWLVGGGGPPGAVRGARHRGRNVVKGIGGRMEWNVKG